MQSLEISTAVAFGCSLAGALYIPINKFANKVRFYKNLSPEKFPKLQGLLQNPVHAKRIDIAHGKFNWGLLEMVFGGIVIGGENGIRALLDLPFDVPSLLQYSTSTGLAIFTQQVWDRAVGRYKDLLDLDPTLSQELKDANMLKRGAFGSLASVLGFTAANSHLLPVKIVGYLTLGALGITGRIYEKQIDAKIARRLKEINSCNLSLEPE